MPLGKHAPGPSLLEGPGVELLAEIAIVIGVGGPQPWIEQAITHAGTEHVAPDVRKRDEVKEGGPRQPTPYVHPLLGSGCSHRHPSPSGTKRDVLVPVGVKCQSSPLAGRDIERV